jgi:hypothetical protein
LYRYSLGRAFDLKTHSNGMDNKDADAWCLGNALEEEILKVLNFLLWRASLLFEDPELVILGSCYLPAFWKKSKLN